uniref:Cysteine protease n=1 Tax=Elaeophora elaphi TaxID=1147741 RepID=A0A0R3RWD9_9BILA
MNRNLFSRRLFADWKPTVSKMLETYLTLDPGFSDAQNYALFDSNLPIYLLGEKFTSRRDMGRIKEFMSSLLWFTYRKNFQPIGGTGPTTDQGWGCMLRCGQMLLARVLIVRHLGRNWLWDRDIKLAEYKRILRMFQDKKNCLFSIHQIGFDFHWYFDILRSNCSFVAHMGVSEGKEIGEWFGPNTAAQVLKKLVIYDQWSRLTVHVALDNVLITSDIRTMAFTKPPCRKSGSRRETGSDYNDNHDAINPAVTIPNSPIKDGNVAEAEILPELTRSPTRSETSSVSSYGGVGEEWRPLLIIIPLRLGLSTINRCYFPAIQAFFQLPQCVGIIGGRPNHALYFCGIADNNLLYLDPHFCQDFVDLDETTTTKDERDGYVEIKNDEFKDSTYHCPFILSTKIDKVDPSLALGFLCHTEDDYNELSQRLRTHLLPASTPPLFEMLETRPKNFPPFVPYVGENTKLRGKFLNQLFFTEVNWYQ